MKRSGGILAGSRGSGCPTACTCPSRGAVERRPVGAWSLVLPAGAAFTHRTAARVLGWWLPAEVEHPVFAAAWDPTTCVRRAGLRVVRHQVPLPVAVVEGVRVTSPAETLLAMARDLSVLDLVVLGDSALHLEQCTLEEAPASSRPAPLGSAAPAPGRSPARPPKRVALGVAAPDAALGGRGFGGPAV